MNATDALADQLDLLQYVSREVKFHQNKRDVPDIVRVTLDMSQRMLVSASPVFVADWVIDGLERAVDTFPEDYVLNWQDVPFPVGFARLERSVVLATRPNARFVKIDAVSWSYDQRAYRDGSVSVVIYGCTPQHPEAKQQPLMEPKGVFLIDLGKTLHPRMRTSDKWVDTADGKYVVRDGDPDFLQALWDTEERFVQRFVVGLWLFMQQTRMVEMRESSAPRALRRQWARANVQADPIIRTIVLRAAQQPHDAPEGALPSPTKEYSVRWVVRGHWHRYWVNDPVTMTRRLKPRWIEPYVKGPEGAPLNAPLKLFAVTK